MIQKDSSTGRHTCKCICTKNRTSKSWSKKLAELKGEIDYSTHCGDFNTPLWAISRTTRQRTGKGIKDLKNTINHFDLIDTQYILPNNGRIDVLFSCMWHIYQDRLSNF